MGRLIDVDEFLKRVEKDRKHEIYMHSWTADDILKRLDSYYAPTVLTIPDNPTNGDMCIAILKPRKDQIRYEGDWVEIEIQKEGINFSASKDWWDAPCKRGNEDGSN